MTRKIIRDPLTQIYRLHKVFNYELSNKWSAKVICRIDRLRTAHSKRQTSYMSLENLLAAHASDYIVVRVKPGLTSHEDLATALVGL